MRVELNCNWRLTLADEATRVLMLNAQRLIEETVILFGS
jgi:hypothetical protein